MTEIEMRESEGAHPKTIDELVAYIKTLEGEVDDYGKTVYAVSLASYATFNYMAHVGGITGFQAGCADLDILKRTRMLKHGFKIVDFGNLLYPQYCDEDEIPGWETIMRDNLEHLSKEAQKLLDEQTEYTHPDVVAHWQKLARAKV
jgi:hypothetical protein